MEQPSISGKTLVLLFHFSARRRIARKPQRNHEFLAQLFA